MIYVDLSKVLYQLLLLRLITKLKPLLKSFFRWIGHLSLFNQFILVILTLYLSSFKHFRHGWIVFHNPFHNLCGHTLLEQDLNWIICYFENKWGLEWHSEHLVSDNHQNLMFYRRNWQYCFDVEGWLVLNTSPLLNFWKAFSILLLFNLNL